MKTTGYQRKYAIGLLNGRRQRSQGPIKRPRRAVYGSEEARALLILSRLFDHINSKRLRKGLGAELQGLYKSGFLEVSYECYQKLKQVSPATMDRLLDGRRGQPGKRRGFRKPGTLLKHQIPVRTWAGWTEDRPGFCEMDLVDHSGGRIIRGADHAWTLCFTDVKTCPGGKLHPSLWLTARSTKSSITCRIRCRNQLVKRHERLVFDNSRSVSGSVWALQTSRISPVGEKPEAGLLLVKDRQ